MRWRVGLLVALVVAACVGVAWLLAPASAPAPADALDVRVDVPADDPRIARPGAEARPTDASAGALPPPVDLEQCDRDLDLFGVVVDRSGAPIAGADLVCVTYPWTRIVSRKADQRADARLGPSTQSATDGSFRLRLERGESVTLRASATGFASVELPYRRSGERVRVELGRATTLIVRTVDGSGEGVAGTRLRLFGGGEVALRREATTDADGVASWTDLPPERRCTLRIEPVSLAGSVLRVVTPASGQATIDVPLLPGGSVTGRVTDGETEEPIEGARVLVEFGRLQTAVTDADGRYQLPGWLPAGATRHVAVLAEGYAREQVRARSGTAHDFALGRGVAATGRAVDDRGTPVAGAHVTAAGWAWPSGVEVQSAGYAISGEDGRFHVADLRAGLEHRLLVVARGRGRRLVSWSSATPDAGDIVLGPPRLLRGRVVDAAGAPVARVPVRLIQPLRDREVIGDPQESTRTDDLGRFGFGELAREAYVLRAEPPGAPLASGEATIPEEGDVEEVVLTLAAGRRVAVRVTDESGAGVANAFVAALVEKSQWSATQTDGAGVSTLTVPDQPTRVRVSPPRDAHVSYLPVEHLDLPDGATTIDVVLTVAAHVAGRVVRADGTPPPQRTWVDAMQGYERIARGWTQPDGSFDVVVPATGLVSVVFGGPAGGSDAGNNPLAELDARVDGVAAGTTDVVLQLGPIAKDRTLTVRLFAPNGAPAPRARFAYHQAPGDKTVFASTDASGNAKLQGLTRRRLSVSIFPQFERGWMPPSDGEIEVVPHGQEIDVRFVEAVQFHGHVVTADGSAIHWGEVRALVGGRVVGSGHAGREGLFIVFVPATENGPFRLEARRFGKSRDLSGALDAVDPGARDLKIVVESE